MIKLANKLLNQLYFFWCHFYLKNILGVKKVGRKVTFQRGFRIYNGANHLTIGNNVDLVDVLINAGDSYHGEISIGNDVFMGHGVQIISRGHDFQLTGDERKNTIVEKQIQILDGAWIGSRAIILGGVTIGKNSVIGAGSVVTKSVPDNNIYGGVPARYIKQI